MLSGRCRPTVSDTEMIPRCAALKLGLVGVVLGTLYAGLQPFAFSPPNRARPAEAGPGLVFEAPSMAISEAPLVWRGDPAACEVTVHLWIEPDVESCDRFGALLSLSSDSQLPSFLVAQWKEGLNLRVRSDNPRGYWEIGAPGVLEAGRLTLVTITSSRVAGTRILIDGAVRAQSSRTAYVSTDEPFGGRLLLGCLSHGDARWAGTVLGVAIQDEAIVDEEVAQLAGAIRSDGFAILSGSRSLRALYLFEPPLFEQHALERSERGRIPNAYSPSEAGALVVPDVFRPAKRSVLAVPTWGDMTKRWFRIDLPLNIGGFMPLGFLLGLLLYRRGEPGIGAVALQIGLLGLGLSLTIESVQVFLPDRSSSLLDLLANVVGTCAGFALVLLLERLDVC